MSQYDLDRMEVEILNDHAIVRHTETGRSVQFWGGATSGGSFGDLRRWADSPNPLLHMTHGWLQSVWNRITE